MLANGFLMPQEELYEGHYLKEQKKEYLQKHTKEEMFDDHSLYRDDHDMPRATCRNVQFDKHAAHKINRFYWMPSIYENNTMITKLLTNLLLMSMFIYRSR